MRKLLAASVAAVCSVTMLQGCGRNGSPIAPARSEAPAPAQTPVPTPAAVRAISIGGSASDGTFTIGQNVQLRAVARLIDGSEQDVTSLAEWASTDPSVATVSAGLVTAVRRGAARVRATYQDTVGETEFSIVEGQTRSGPTGPTGPTGPDSTSGGGSTPPTGPTSPTVPGPTSTGGSMPPTVQRLVITGEPTVPQGGAGQFRATAYMSDGSQKDVTGSSTWGSDNSLIGSISQSGMFLGLMPGSNVVTANYNGTTASQPVQVTPL